MDHINAHRLDSFETTVGRAAVDALAASMRRRLVTTEDADDHFRGDKNSVPSSAPRSGQG